ncbi:hypothetical protein EKD04_017295 [Chloroflexales bacterium ZM16-3]|nr:hypothetical protein [Chloroflexales bacterium ZM16-3]
MPNIPPATKEELLAAMRRFDAEFRSLPRWVRWPTRADRFALLHDGKRYPVKFIISLATSYSVSGFSGGNEANTYVGKRGLTVITL